MPHEREPIRLPTYQSVLRAYDSLVTGYLTDPTPQHLERVFAQQARLLAELARPGRVELGRIFQTPGAHEAMVQAFHHPAEFLLRHQHADWGDLDAHDRRVNAEELAHRGRLLSSYATRLGERLWVITDAGWTTTTLLLPKDY